MNHTAPSEQQIATEAPRYCFLSLAFTGRRPAPKPGDVCGIQEDPDRVHRISGSLKDPQNIRKRAFFFLYANQSSGEKL